jgi:two-component system sensor histidine kinase KdpD
MARAWEHVPVSHPTALLARAVRENRSLWIGSREQYLATEDRTTDRPVDTANQARAAIPFVLHGKVVGAIWLTFAQPQDFDAQTRDFAQALAGQCAQALERARLFEAEAAARREADRAMREAERQNELRLRFLGMISHELRTPLTSIKGFASTLLAEDVGWDADSQRDFLQTIDSEADKLTDMVEQLLDLSRIEAGTIRVDPQPQTLASVLEVARAQLEALAQVHVLQVAIPPDLPPVRADALRIAQVLTNLVSNAAKYSPAETAITVVASTQDAGFVRVSVGDEGPGIRPEDRPFVFEAFRRGSDSAARQTKGAGLGLAICKGIVEAHGGRIWIEAREGPGATVSFTLPVAG